MEKIKEMWTFLRNSLSKNDKIMFACILLVLITASIMFFTQTKISPKSEEINSNVTKEKIDTEKILDAIKYLESENPPRLGKSPTEEEIQNSPYIKQIRIALNGYLDGTNNGLEEGALDATSEDMKCGFNNFNKTYYQSKFVILDAYDNDYGGVQAYIIFVDKPDTVFFVWIYGIVGEQRLRAFCEKPITSQDETDYINEAIKISSYKL